MYIDVSYANLIHLQDIDTPVANSGDMTSNPRGR